MRSALCPMLVAVLLSGCSKEEEVPAPPTSASDPRAALMGTYTGTLSSSSYNPEWGSNSSMAERTFVVELDAVEGCFNIVGYRDHLLLADDLTFRLSPLYHSGPSNPCTGRFVPGDTIVLQVSSNSSSPMASWNSSFTGYKH